MSSVLPDPSHILEPSPSQVLSTRLEALHRRTDGIDQSLDDTCVLIMEPISIVSRWEGAGPRLPSPVALQIWKMEAPLPF